MESSPDLVFVIDTNLIYREVYGDTVRVLGMPESKIIGKTHRQVFGNRFYRERENQYRRALKGETVLYSWTSHYEKKTFYFETMISPIYNKDKTIIGVVGVSRDITEQENRYKEMPGTPETQCRPSIAGSGRALTQFLPCPGCKKPAIRP